MDKVNNTNNIGSSSLSATTGTNILAKAFAVAVIRERIRTLARIRDGEDVRDCLVGGRTARYNTQNRIRKQLKKKS